METKTATKPGFEWAAENAPTPEPAPTPDQSDNKIATKFIGAIAIIAGLLWMYSLINDAGWILHRKSVDVSFERGRTWMEGETRQCSFYPTEDSGALYCEWMPGVTNNGETHTLALRFYGRVDRLTELPPSHNRWKCQRNKMDLLQHDPMTCWAIN